LRFFALFLFLISANFIYAQEKSENKQISLDQTKTDSIEIPQKVSIIDANENDSISIYKPTKEDYKFFVEDKDTLLLTKEFTIQDYYKKNFTEKDYFGKMLPKNLGSAFNDLSYIRDSSPINRLLPVGKMNSFMTVDDIRYFDVKTPTTEIDYESGVKQGQFLSTLFTHNPNSQINYSVQYKGLRSLGKYQEELAVNNVMLLGLNYHTKNKRYRFLAHHIIQNMDNEESGGIKNRSDFENKSTAFATRLRIPVSLSGVYTEYNSRRTHATQYFRLFGINQKKDSTQTKRFLDIKNSFTHEKNLYVYSELQENPFFTSPTIAELIRRNENNQINFENTVGLSYQHNPFFSTEIGHLFNEISYSTLISMSSLPNRIKTSFWGGYANFKTKIKELIQINGSGRYSHSTDYDDPYSVTLNAKIIPKKGFELYANQLVQSAIPKMNYQLNQSFYLDYNYYNPNFKNENTEQTEIGVNISPYKTNLKSSYTKLSNFIYLNENYLAQQNTEAIKIFMGEIENTLHIKKIYLTTQIRYQNLHGNKAILPLPEWVGRASLYYLGPAFKNKSELQTGFNVYYFSAFQSREISPLHNEYKLQSSANAYSIGEVPNVDVFFNLKVKRMEIHLKIENLSSTFTSGYYTLPNVPYTDWRFRFGIKWYLFT
jgi:hypothetical protein